MNICQYIVNRNMRTSANVLHGFYMCLPKIFEQLLKCNRHTRYIRILGIIIVIHILLKCLENNRAYTDNIILPLDDTVHMVCHGIHVWNG